MGVPVLGQPFTILSYMVLPVIHCNCERGGIVSLMAQTRAAGMQRTMEACPSCGRTFALQGLSIDDRGQLQISVEISQAAPELVTQ